RLHLEFDPARDVVERECDPAVHGSPRSPDGAKRNPGQIWRMGNPGFRHSASQTRVNALMTSPGLRSYTSIVAVTGTWSEGRSQPRACLAMSRRATRSPSCGDTQM